MLIKLFIEPYDGKEIWFAQFVDAPEIIEAFGTDIFPTAFYSTVDFDKVRDHVAAAFGCKVVEG